MIRFMDGVDKKPELEIPKKDVTEYEDTVSNTNTNAILIILLITIPIFLLYAGNSFVKDGFIKNPFGVFDDKITITDSKYIDITHESNKPTENWLYGKLRDVNKTTNGYITGIRSPKTIPSAAFGVTMKLILLILGFLMYIVTYILTPFRYMGTFGVAGLVYLGLLFIGTLVTMGLDLDVYKLLSAITGLGLCIMTMSAMSINPTVFSKLGVEVYGIALIAALFTISMTLLVGVFTYSTLEKIPKRDGIDNDTPHVVLVILSILMIISVYILFLSSTYINKLSDYRSIPGFIMIALIPLAVMGVLVLYHRNDVTDEVFYLKSNDDHMKSNYYECTLLTKSKNIIDWCNSDEALVSFNINLNYIVDSDKTLIVCKDDNGNITWEINYRTVDESINLLYKDEQEISLPITEDMILTKKDGISYTTVTIEVKTRTDLDSNPGIIMLYSDYDQINDSQIINKNDITKPSSWGKIIAVPEYGIIENLVYCTKPDDDVGTDGNYDAVIVIILSILSLVFILSLINPKVRETMFGWVVLPNKFNIGKKIF